MDKRKQHIGEHIGDIDKEQKNIDKNIQKATAVEKLAIKTYNNLRKKHLNATIWYITLNVMSLLLVASLIVSNLWALRWNHIKFDSNIRLLFLLGVALNAVSALLTSVLSFFELRPKSQMLKNALIDIDREFAQWKQQENKYKRLDRNSRIITVVNMIAKKTI